MNNHRRLLTAYLCLTEWSCDQGSRGPVFNEQEWSYPAPHTARTVLRVPGETDWTEDSLFRACDVLAHIERRPNTAVLDDILRLGDLGMSGRFLPERIVR